MDTEQTIVELEEGTIETLKDELTELRRKQHEFCAVCGNKMTPNGTTEDGLFRIWYCRPDRGGCGAIYNESGRGGGRPTIGDRKLSPYERLKRHREKKRKEKKNNSENA